MHGCDNPVKGCIQSSMVIRLSDPFAYFRTTDLYRQGCRVRKVSPHQWRETVLPKISGSLDLHQQLPCALDFFVLFSFATDIVGSQSQSNYAAGNTFQDALAHLRRSHGEAATSINICVVDSIGILADQRDVSDQIICIKHVMPMSEDELLALLDEHCQPASSSSPRPR